jgi:hypothetical protein
VIDSEEGDKRHAISPFYVPSSKQRPQSNTNDNRIVSGYRQEVVRSRGIPLNVSVIECRPAFV